MQAKYILQAPAEAAGSTGGDSKPRFCVKEYDLDTGVVTFTFGNGTVEEIDSNKLSEEISKQCKLHGISQKGGDSYAGRSKTNDYAGAIEDLKGVRDALYAGSWGVARDDDARPRLAELAEAIAKLKNAPIEKAMAAVEAATDEQRKAWRTNAEVKHAIQQIRLEKAQKALEESRAAGGTALEVNFA